MKKKKAPVKRKTVRKKKKPLSSFPPLEASPTAVAIVRQVIDENTVLRIIVSSEWSTLERTVEELQAVVQDVAQTNYKLAVNFTTVSQIVSELESQIAELRAHQRGLEEQIENLAAGPKLDTDDANLREQAGPE